MNLFRSFRKSSSPESQAGLSLLQMLGVLMLVGIAAAVLLKQWA